MAIEWKIKYWPPKDKNDIERWFKKLTNEQQKSIVKVLTMLRIGGNEIKLPHSRSLGKKLFELREGRFGYRIYYMFYEEYIIVLLTAGDKTTQQNDIKTARTRLIEVTKYGRELL
ncbi:MAG TPA: type II toxin-antitoxin system RelE/ParE family toxin [Candidatus Babeliales bacterium]|nr:type II toxin-antitoxin system RelE/ParE family toxin [Candidatus Babeliales bacterium]